MTLNGQRQLTQRLGCTRERNVSGFRHQNRVGEAETADSGEVDPRLDAEHHVRPDLVLVAVREERRLVPRHAETVSGAGRLALDRPGLADAAGTLAALIRSIKSSGYPGWGCMSIF